MRIFCCNVSCPSTNSVLNILRGAVTGASIHVTAGGVCGGLGAMMISPVGLTPADAAKVGAIGGALIGTGVHAIRGYYDAHFKPHLSMNHAWAELSSGYLLVNIQALAGKWICGSSWQSVGSIAALASIPVGATALALLVAQCCCPSISISSNSKPESASQMAARYSTKV